MNRSTSATRGWRHYVNGLIADQFAPLTRYFDRVIQWRPRPTDEGVLLSRIDAQDKAVVAEGESLPPAVEGERRGILLNGNPNHSYDIQGLISEIRPSLSRGDRLLLVTYNPYMSWLYRLAAWVGIRQGELPTTFVTCNDLEHLCSLEHLTMVRSRMVGFIPFRLLGLGTLFNRLLSSTPGVRWMGLAHLSVLRPTLKEEVRPSLSIVIPARNEKGNIAPALERLPDLGCDLEIIFVEGHSSDGTWQEIERVCNAYKGPHSIQAMQQTGCGKADAVRLGFSMATGDLLTILDADLTMPPEQLGAFYQAYLDGLGDFVNGSRMVYPMEGEAMRFLNWLGNVFFAKALSWVLGVRIGDSLCGTKMFSRSDYVRMIQWRADFGDFDPFGDFEMLFPAAELGLGVIDIPVRYRARTYGSTNISRFRHGLVLLRMTAVGLWRIKWGFARGTH